MPQTIAIKERIRHPDYKRPSEYHDIAILRLEKKVTYDAFVRPACLPVDWPDVGQDNKAVATGWGLVDWSDDKGSDNLLKVTLNLVSHEACNESFYDGGSSTELALGIVNEWQICAGEVGKDTCQGDSGGPLAVFNTDHDCMYTIIGVTSLGRFCGSIIPGVYTRVYHYIPWIERTAWLEYFETPS
ncbi:PREDICTED: serine protease snake-like [Vollenhovia emeryi]|uniref:serine protease snake-like n=1 Tax=Vollenhovia emeryi TaxID=411798 RepID=UPI0005F414B6|nr:PREDICTED: serine protease snake-like [Vollenhovia emeryi]